MATYEEIKNVPNQPEICLIDVRNPDEIENTGLIPASINIPLPVLEEALQKSEDDFKLAYGREKPLKDTPIIFTCRSGRRVVTAETQAKNLGYENVKIYSGSWLEWAEKEGLTQ